MRTSIFTTENFENHLTALCDATLDSARVADKTLWGRGLNDVNIEAFVYHFGQRLAYVDAMFN